MKKLLFILIALTISSTQQEMFGQWESDVRLTYDTSISYSSFNNTRYVAASGDVVHIVWYDYRNNNFEIFYKRSRNGGTRWGADLRLTTDTSNSEFPCLAISGPVVHVLWHDLRDGNWEIYYKRSTDNGLSWGIDTRLTNNTGESRFPSVTVSGSSIHIVWSDHRDGNLETYYKRSTDNGITWSADIRLTNNSAISRFPSVAISGSIVHIIWWDDRDWNDEIYYKRSTDGGVTWGADTRLTNDPEESYLPSVSVSGQVVHVVWRDERDGNYEIYYKRSTNGGITWGVDTRLTNDPEYSDFPIVTSTVSGVHVVWHDLRDGNYEIYYKHSTNNGISWEADLRLTDSFGLSINPSIALSGSVVHIVWYDERDGNGEIYYKRDPTGNPIGIINISSEIPNQFSLSQNYPNPFNPTTKIQFALPKNSFATLVVYDALGRELETLVNEQLIAGTYEADWNADKYSSGVYYYKLTAGDYTETKKMVLMK